MSLPCFAADPAGALPLHLVAPDGWRDRPGAALAAAQGFRARPGEHALLLDGEAVTGALVGRAEGPLPYGALPHALPEGTRWVGGDADLALGWALGAYRFTRFKAPRRAAAQLVPQAGFDDSMARAIWHARDLVNMPASHLGPAELAEAVEKLGAAHGAAVRIIEGAELAQGFPALALVGAGSPRAPRVAVLEWGTEGPLLALCGKGVCFDTGGLDLKPPAGMLRMKKDMGGAAVMLALADCLMARRARLRLLVLVGAVENGVSGTAFRPGDVLRTRKGLTVEVGNTDAEGRLVLADLLAFAAERAPDAILDGATLTGAARVALGPDLPALFSNDEALAGALLAGAEAARDPLWRLPLHGGYDSWLDSPVADLNNVAGKPMAGAIVAALFLRRFVPHGTPWAHLDLYAWNDSNRPGAPEGGEATGLRGLLAGIERWMDAHPRS
ncbi:leucyl aminopeptidase family protein [Sabulicella glaciei]|uniref:Leucyl aminopeptidase family protein n=1 Tax=Sabulicella glaciei TaxID=2984948 RepID=A0ABT3NSU9_9PROT|nr:leucyl aminopeptidase family protein [Roseococcus sp. MDT2-1-1]MCW8085234.1 leucyl aminopeptidase family protein [Roseococcus sp. MDT2-1-1]